MVEGAFVDRWEDARQNAVASVTATVERHPMTPEQAGLLRAGVRDDAAPPDAVAELLTELSRLRSGSLTVLERDPDPLLRGVHGWALAREEDSRRRRRLAWERAELALRSADPLERVAAVEALAQLRGHPLARTSIIASMDDPDARVRRAAAAAVTDRDDYLDDQTVLRHLPSRLNHHDVWVRRAAARLVSRQWSRAGIADALVERLVAEEDPAAFLSIARSIGAHHPELVLPTLTAILNGAGDTQLRIDAAFCLFQLGPAGRAPLTAALQDSDWRLVAFLTTNLRASAEADRTR